MAIKDDIAALYVGYFNRGADPEGLNVWIGAANSGMSLEQIATYFSTSAEAKAIYPFLAAPNLGVGVEEFVTDIYLNLFERVPDPAGLAFWTAQISSGAVSPAEAILAIMGGAQGQDKVVLDNKTAVSAYYADQFALAGDNPWTVEDDRAGAVDALNGNRDFWTSPTAVAQAEARTDQIVADSFAETFDLTPGPDNFVGTSAGDVFNAPVQQTAFLPIQTLNTDDSLNGAGGRNTLNAQLVDPYVSPVLLQNIQVLNIGAPAGLTPLLVDVFVPVVLDLVNANAFDEVNFRSPIQSIGVMNVSTVLDSVSILDNAAPNLAGFREFTISFTGNALDGDDDELDLTVRNDSVNTILNLLRDNGPIETGYETVNIHSLGGVQNRLELNASVESVFVDGVADLRIRGDVLDLASLRLFDSTELDAPAGVNAFFHGGNGGETDILTGEGDDRLVFRWDSNGVIVVNTAGGDDYVNFWDHEGPIDASTGEGNDELEVDVNGDVTADLGNGDNIGRFGDVQGSVNVVAGSGADDLFFEEITGNVTANAGDGDNDLWFHRVDGVINAVAGSGNDFFDFDDVWQGGWGTHTFGPGDSINGGGGVNRVRFEVESFVGNRDLVTGGAIENIQTATHHGSFGNNDDLLVNFTLLGSVMRLELQGEYGDDVRITNLNNTDGGIDMVAIQSDIREDLVLSRAFVTIPAFHLEIGNDHNPDGSLDGSGVVVGRLIAGTGTDLFTITSVGTITDPVQDANEFTNVQGVDGNVILQGSTDLDFGSNDEGAAYDENNGQIDATALSGDDEIWIDDGHQTVRDGDGDDFIGTWDNDSAADLIFLAAGANTVRFHAFNNDNDAGGIGSVPRELHEVDGFNSGNGAGADLLQVSLDSDGIGNITDTDNDNVAAGDFANIRNVQVGDVINLQDSNINFLKFTTAATAGNVEDLFDLVLGAGVIDVANGTDWVLASAYDATFANADGSVGAMVVFAIDGGNQITSGDDCAGLATVGMSYTDYLAFDSGNFQFVA